MGFIGVLVKSSIIAAVVYYAAQHWLQTKSYALDEAQVVQIGARHSIKGIDLEERLARVRRDLRAAFGQHLVPEERLQWVDMSAGGWFGRVCVLHASLTEYLLLFGTALESRGHSGRHLVNVTDVVLTGQLDTWPERTFHVRSYFPGDTARHDALTVAYTRYHDNTWMLEYGRGLVVSSLPFSVGDSIFSTFDVFAIYQLFKVYSVAMWHEYSSVITAFL